jgi:hypothetical protein
MGATLASNPESRTAAQDRALHDPFSHARIWLTTTLVLALEILGFLASRADGAPRGHPRTDHDPAVDE